MEVKNTFSDDYRSYADFWNTSVQKIDEIHKELDLSLRELERQYPLFEQHYNKVSNLADVMSSIYAGINTLDGREDILKLKAFIDTYKMRYTRDGIDFDSIDYLLEKINILRSKSLQNFPVLDHADIPGKSESAAADQEYLSWPYRWFTFRRGWSWFMVSYRDLDIYTSDQCSDITGEGSDIIRVSILGTEKLFYDLFSKCRKKYETPKLLITIDKKNNFAVTQPGKKIFSRFDFISPRIRKYPDDRIFTLSPGRVRLFGIGHVYLDLTHPHESASSI